jgi:hypothetical protein
MAMNDGGPAFPGRILDGDELTTEPAEVFEHLTAAWVGMSLRDYFAGQALNMAGTYRVADDEDGNDETAQFIAERAYALADAMIRAREAQPHA